MKVHKQMDIKIQHEQVLMVKQGHGENSWQLKALKNN